MRLADMNQDGMKIGQRLKHAWNAFTGKTQQDIWKEDLGVSYYSNPERVRIRTGSDRTILAGIITKIATDVASVKIQHSKLDENDRYLEPVKSGLNYCLNTEANIDQTSRAFKQDIVTSLLDDGSVAVVPIETTFNPRDTGSYDIKNMRVAKILDWYPQHVKLDVYNERTGKRQNIILPKAQVAIIENPLYSVMNEPNSTLKRLVYKLNLLDAADDQNLSGKLDLIIQLPYPIKTEMRRQEAEKRRKDIETQLTSNKYGIAYTDGTEKITQLNRTVENKLMDQIEYLTSTLYSQLGMSKEVFEGTADERLMLNYISRTIDPIVSAITEEFNRKFLTKTARSQHQKMLYFIDTFKLATLDSITANGSTLVAAEIATKNEVREKLGLRPVNDERADQLMNPNINPQDPSMADPDAPADWEAEYEDSGSGTGTTVADMKVSDILNS